MNFETFKAIHEQQLLAIPEQLWPSAFEQTCQSPMDTKGWLTLVPTGASDHQPPVLTAGQDLPKNSALFIIDPIWSFSGEQEAKQALQNKDGLLEQLESMLGKAKSTESSLAEQAHALLNPQEETQLEEHQEMIDLLAQQSGKSEKECWEAYKKSGFQLVEALSVGFCILFLSK
jgi:NACalpha-BTF3-like transcription factor